MAICDTNDDVILYKGNIIMYDYTLTANFQHPSQFLDTDNITHRDQRKNVQMTGILAFYKATV
jgi:hypothetical protein